MKKDDLCTFNKNELGNKYNDIYPNEPELKKNNENLQQSCLIKEMVFHLALLGQQISHLKYLYLSWFRNFTYFQDNNRSGK